MFYDPMISVFGGDNVKVNFYEMARNLLVVQKEIMIFSTIQSSYEYP